MSSFLERLAQGAVVADGGTGALLSAAVPRLRCPEEANVKAPESVISVHVGFIRAGAELIETNTFGANRRKLSAQFLDERLDEIVERGVKLAREAREEEIPGPRHPRHMPHQMQGMPYGYLPQPPVIVLAGNGMHPQSMPAYPGMPQPRLTNDMLAAPPQSVIDSREFRVVGETDDSLDEW